MRVVLPVGTPSAANVGWLSTTLTEKIDAALLSISHLP